MESFRIGTTGASTQVDPQIAYGTTAWWVEYRDCGNALQLPGQARRGWERSLRPEVASRFKISKDGRRYTFFIRKGFRFSDGTQVTARSFKYAIDRVANHDLASPGAQFTSSIRVETNILGAKDVNNGLGTHVRGVCSMVGNRLIIPTDSGRRDFPHQDHDAVLPGDLDEAAESIARSPSVSGVNDIPSAGPYALSRNDVNVVTSIRKNPYWSRGPGRQRPRNVTGVELYWNLNEETAYQQVLAGELDETLWLPPAHVQDLADRFGVNRTRFWSMPVNCTGYLPMNMSRPLFKGNLALRRAINYAISRQAYIAQAGPYTGQPLTRLLNPGVPRLDEREPLSARSRPGQSESPRSRPLSRRQDHGLVRPERADQPGAGIDRPTGLDRPSASTRRTSP